MSNKSSVQLHVTFDVGDKHGDIFTYVEIPRIFFNIFMITFGKILYVLDVHAKRGLFVLFILGFSSNLYSQKCLGTQLQGTASF